MTGISIGVIVIFFLFIFSFDIMKFYKIIQKHFKYFHRVDKPQIY
jgi:hypothetical protein